MVFFWQPARRKFSPFFIFKLSLLPAGWTSARHLINIYSVATSLTESPSFCFRCAKRRILPRLLCALIYSYQWGPCRELQLHNKYIASKKKKTGMESVDTALIPTRLYMVWLDALELFKSSSDHTARLYMQQQRAFLAAIALRLCFSVNIVWGTRHLLASDHQSLASQICCKAVLQ